MNMEENCVLIGGNGAPLPQPQFLALSRPSSYSLAGGAADIKLKATCRQPDVMLFSPRKGLMVYNRPQERGATPLSTLSAPKV